MSPFGVCGQGHPESRGSSLTEGGSGPGPPVPRTTPWSGRWVLGDITRTLGSTLPLRQLHHLLIFRLLSFSFRETVAQGPSGLVPVFTAQAAEPGCLFLAGNCCCWALPPPFRDPPQSAAVAQGRLGGDRGEMPPSAPACRFRKSSRLVTLSLSAPSEAQCEPEQLSL